MTKTKRHAAAFKAKVALEALKGGAARWPIRRLGSKCVRR